MTEFSLIISPMESAVILPDFGFLTDRMLPLMLALTSEYSKARSQFSIVQLMSVKFSQ